MSLTVELHNWAISHGVTGSAVRALHQVLSSFDASPEPIDPEHLSGEARVQSQVRLEAAQHGYWLTRNNVGAYQDPRSIECAHCGMPALGGRKRYSARWIRYGLCNESKQQNALVKSHDLIGFRKRVIVSSDVGSIIAQFVSRECKAEGWVESTADTHEQAQRAFRDFVNSNGGDSAFAAGPGSFQPRLMPLTLRKP